MQRTTLSISLCLMTSLGFGLGAEVQAKKLTARQIMEEQRDRHKVKNEYEVQQMILVDKKGKKEPRKLHRFAKEFKNDQYRALLVFLAPSDIKGVSLLAWQNKSKADDQWLFLPSEGKPKRVASGSKKNYFMGTDLTYEDMESEDVDSKKYKILREEKCDKNKTCWVIEAKPKNKKAAKESAYGKRILWIRKDIFVATKIEFYNRRAKKVVKTIHNRGWINIGGKAYRAQKSLVDNVKKKHKTLVVTTKRSSDALGNEIFKPKYLSSGRQTNTR